MDILVYGFSYMVECLLTDLEPSKTANITCIFTNLVRAFNVEFLTYIFSTGSTEWNRGGPIHCVVSYRDQCTHK